MTKTQIFTGSPLAVAIILAFPAATITQSALAETALLEPITVEASADASAEGLSPAYPGGQVARGGRAGILGTRDNADTPFSITSYTNELIQDKQARSVGDVLQNDPSVRVARGFGNFQESYFIRGFILNSDDTAFNGLYGLLPRQYIATELFERVEVLRGASSFLSGATPGGGGLGGAINLVPKRAPNEPLTRVTAGLSSGSHKNIAADVARRFGPNQSTGVRVNAALRDGGTAVDGENAELGLLSVGMDWRGTNARLSADLGWQDNRLKQTRTNVSLSGVTAVPSAPNPETNWAQPWSYSNERDLFGTIRGEYDFSSTVTAWGAWGFRKSDESNSLANLTVTDSATGDGSFYRFDNAREDTISTGELGLRGTLLTGSVGHDWVVSASYFEDERKNAYGFDSSNSFASNLYAPQYVAQPAFSGGAFFGNDLNAPALTNRIGLTSIAAGDTLSLLDDSLSVTLGARHQAFKLENFAYNTGLAGSVYDKSRVSPMLGVVYKPTQQLSVYGNYIEGLTQGDTASGTPTPVNNGEILEPYVTKQKEIGLKYDGGRFAVSGALFSTSKPRSLITADNVFTSEGEDRHRGLETNFQGEASRNIRVLGGATWLQAKQESTGSATTDGKNVIGVPRFMANVGVEWDLSSIPGLTLDGRVVHTGESYADATNTLEVAGWTRTDLGVRYLLDVGDELLTIRARVDNVSDRAYWASSGGFPGSGYLVAGSPRTFSLSAAIDF